MAIWRLKNWSLLTGNVADNFGAVFWNKPSVADQFQNAGTKD